MSYQSDFFANNAPTSTSYVCGLLFVPTSQESCPSTSKVCQKNRLFAPLFVQSVFVKLPASTSPIGNKLSGHCQWALTMLLQWSIGSSRAYLVFRPGTDSNSLFCHFFQILVKRVITINVTADKIGPTCCPTSHREHCHSIS